MNKREFIIPFVGLKLGIHNYDFTIQYSFFDGYEMTEFTDCNIKVDLELTKRSTFMELSFQVSGTITSKCDRCGDELKLKITNNEKVIVKFGEIQSEEDDIIVIAHNEQEIDVSNQIYQSILLAIPMSRRHEDGACDPQTIAYLENILENENKTEEDPIDPRWDKLVKLKKNNLN